MWTRPDKPFKADLIIDHDQRRRIEDPTPFQHLARQLVATKLLSRKKLTELKAELNGASSEYYEQTIYQEQLKKRLNMLLNKSDIVADLEAVFAGSDAKITAYEETLRQIPAEIKQSVSELMTTSRHELKQSFNNYDELMKLNKAIVDELNVVAKREWDRVPVADRAKHQDAFFKRYSHIAAGVSDEWCEAQSLESLIDFANQIRKNGEVHRRQTWYDYLVKPNPVDEAFTKIIEVVNKRYRNMVKNDSVQLVSATTNKDGEYCLILNSGQLKIYNALLLNAKDKLDHCRKGPLDRLALEKDKTLNEHSHHVADLSEQLKHHINDIIDDINRSKLVKATKELEETVKKELDFIHEHYLDVTREFKAIDMVAETQGHLLQHLNQRVTMVMDITKKMEQLVKSGQVDEVKECQCQMRRSLAELRGEKVTVERAIDDLRQRLKSMVVDNMNQAFGRYAMVESAFGHSEKLRIASQEVQHMRTHLETMNAKLSDLKSKVAQIDKAEQDIHQDQFSGAITEAMRVRHENVEKQRAANAMIARIRVALVTPTNLHFWYGKVRYFGGTLNGHLALPEGVDKIIKILNQPITPAGSEAVLNEVKTVATAMNNKVNQSWKNKVKYGMFHARHEDVAMLYSLLSGLKTDPRENNLDMFHGIPGIELGHVSNLRPQRP